ncbi:MAG: hypothetical protein ABH865_06975 [Candidatus Omnitrophota bacterium]|nr:hypothetical protein [Candidatus Omnitrophota bacterium]
MVKKNISIFLIVWFVSIAAYANNAFDDLCQLINNNQLSSQTYTLDHQFRAKSIQGHGYVRSVEKDGFGDVILRLSTTRDRFAEGMISVTVYVKKTYITEALKYRAGDYIYFSGTLGGASGIAREIIIHNSAISRFHEVIRR